MIWPLAIQYRSSLSSAIIANVPYFFFNAPATTEIYTLSLHDALPISFPPAPAGCPHSDGIGNEKIGRFRSEEHTSDLQSRFDLVCRLLLEKKKRISKKP